MISRDGHIRLLPLHVANKIAAGEVVERPASVLKELLENAIDSGATRIDCVVTAGGRNLVSVRDNGCGMSREDALLSLERQATSKIRDVDDIERIDTLGFRGEAIPSIASVSRFTLTTRREESEEATQLVVNAGVLADVKECGAPAGTCVEVRDLFCNVPARRKFLRAYATEEGHIKSVFTVHALAHPDVGFSLLVDGREVYRFAPGATLEERIHDIFGTSLSEVLLPVKCDDSEDAAVKVYGYVERPDSPISMHRDQFIFINGRPATAPVISYAIRESYPRQKAEARPAIILFIELPPTQVDVNVHPAKREVRFRRPADVREAVIKAVENAFKSGSSVSVAESLAVDHDALTVSTPSHFQVPFCDTLANKASEANKEKIADNRGMVPAPSESPSLAVVPPPVAVPSPACEQVVIEQKIKLSNDMRSGSGPWRWFNYLAETEAGYILLETDNGLVTLNPRAACERIAYERLLDQQEMVSQQLLIPETVKLSPAESSRIRNFRKELEAIGFQIEEFGRDTWKIDALPGLVSDMQASHLLATIAADIAETGAKRGGVRWRDEVLAKTVARSFSGSKTKLTRESAIRLVEDLAATKMPYVCPRGRPVMIFTSNSELNRKFCKT